MKNDQTVMCVWCQYLWVWKQGLLQGRGEVQNSRFPRILLYELEVNALNPWTKIKPISSVKP